MWKQQSRVSWLKEGDRNLKYFHQKASSRKCKNRILKLQDENGDWKEGTHLDNLIVVHFQELFSSAGLEGPTTFLQPLVGCITREMNEALGWDFTK